MANVSGQIYASRLVILQNLFANNISGPEAAKQLATVTLSDNVSHEEGLNRLWNLITAVAVQSPEHHDRLVDVVVDLSELPSPGPDATTQSDEPAAEPLIVQDQEAWRDLPMLGWRFRDYWNTQVRPDSSAEDRQKAISEIINISKFAALLMATDEAVFASYSWFALITLRSALETPTDKRSPREPLEAWVPAAAAWIETLGVEIYSWDEEFEHGPKIGARGKGGPLWDGKHGFCKGRWKLWRERFGEIARMEGELKEEVRKVAEDAETMMREIEDGDVE
ncbi:DUF3632 domain-containing protein [Aspergillus undulatus]|uniref:DUF3632 domain-containing protein n=1 Tax=Aspergillus undulatus TaxID=1810928 RepID=UPI003CCDC10B